jgi:glycosyltransferase involved in cell wall biosynthesis
VARRILLVNWDNYPNISGGGVYTWGKDFVNNMRDCEFVVFNQLSNSNVNAEYQLPDRVKQVIELPLYGTNRYQEYYDEGPGFLRKILRTRGSVIRDEFIPLFSSFLDEVLSDESDAGKLTDLVYRIHSFLLVYDFKKCFEDPMTWRVFSRKVEADPYYTNMNLKSALTLYQTILRSLQILSVRLPRVDLVHCSLAWWTSLLAICVKKDQGIPMVVTEHGVAYRELVFYYDAVFFDEATKALWRSFARNVVKCVYANADKIVPVCGTNAAWVSYLGIDSSKVQVIYNGIDVKRFTPNSIARAGERPTIASVGRIMIYKDILGLIRAVKYVKEVIPDVLCLAYGDASELDYAMQCVNEVKALGVEDNFVFKGRTDEPQTAYNSGDVVAFSSVAEGFPYAIIEAMACGKAIVANDVGGVREALEGAGVLVRSLSPRQFADALISVLQNRELRDRLAAAASAKARDKFNLPRMIEQYKQLYDDLIAAEGGQKSVEGSYGGVVAR